MDSVEAEEWARTCRYGAHCAGVMAPAFFLYVWLPKNCCETRRGPPSLFWCLCGAAEPIRVVTE